MDSSITMLASSSLKLYLCRLAPSYWIYGKMLATAYLGVQFQFKIDIFHHGKVIGCYMAHSTLIHVVPMACYATLGSVALPGSTTSR